MNQQKKKGVPLRVQELQKQIRSQALLIHKLEKRLKTFENSTEAKQIRSLEKELVRTIENADRAYAEVQSLQRKLFIVTGKSDVELHKLVKRNDDPLVDRLISEVNQLKRQLETAQDTIAVQAYKLKETKV